ncbi:Serine/threonine-protein kinase OSR1 [Trichoplax sp. H2]|nr:Serine/threonine-protein kinase OSR1 [Trichoplax sp. H2]|eukprot:RDD40412.1 Serine/threonine-protein kinase OSR1 [Trichoplax sp. H2]
MTSLEHNCPIYCTLQYIVQGSQSSTFLGLESILFASRSFSSNPLISSIIIIFCHLYQQNRYYWARNTVRIMSGKVGEQEKVVWPRKSDDYELRELIGQGASGSVYAGYCKPIKQTCAVKCINLEMCGIKLNEIQREIQLMSQCNHTNVTNYYTTFVVKEELWLVMRLLAGGSIRDIMVSMSEKSNKPLAGILDEVVIATLLRDVLKGLEYFHNNNQIHRDVKAGNILLAADGTVQLADFGVSNWLSEESDRSKQKVRKTFVGTPCWMAPEVVDLGSGYNSKADIWSIGITAIELATGTAPFSKYPAMKVLMLILNNDPPTIETNQDEHKEDLKKYSKVFRKMVESCLQKEPTRRPDATELLKHPFFKKAKDKDYIKEHLLNKAPTLEEKENKMKVKKRDYRRGASGVLHRAEDGSWTWSDGEDFDESPAGAVSNLSSTKSSSNEVTKNLKVEPKKTKPTKNLSFADMKNPTTKTPPVDNKPKPALHEKKIPQNDSKVDKEKDSVGVQSIASGTSAMAISKSQEATQNASHSGKTTETGGSVAMTKEKKQPSRQEPKPVSESSRSVTVNYPGISMPKHYTLKLKLRTPKGGLNEIEFEFVKDKDTIESITNELESAGLVGKQDLQSVAMALDKAIKSFQTIKSLRFPMVIGPDVVKDEGRLIGCGQIDIVKVL